MMMMRVTRGCHRSRQPRSRQRANTMKRTWIEFPANWIRISVGALVGWAVRRSPKAGQHRGNFAGENRQRSDKCKSVRHRDSI
jgi:hypothetical protein